jgi:large subunit ribosomal protein L4
MPTKKITTPASIKPVKKETVKVNTSSLSVSTFTLKGPATTSLSLPKELFGAKINTALLSQALRIYMNNLKSHNSHTKTRSEISLTTKKVYRQKGTGGARHGAKSAPIFVGGGIALGPK